MLQVVNAMNIQLLITADDNRKAFKNYTQIGTDIAAVPTDGMNELQPKVVINYTDAYLKANYMYIPLFGRYYHIDTKNITVGKKIEITGSVDAVMSWYEQLQECDITAVRNGGISYPTKIQDTKFPVIPNEETIDQIPIANSHLTANGTGCYVLQVIGGATNGS